MVPEVSAVLFALVAVIFIAVGLWKFGRGIDGLYSVSNIQVILWTGVVLGGYLAVVVLKGGFLDDIPTNLLYLMGVSVGSTVSSTGIRAIQQPKLPDAARLKEINKDLVTSGLFSSEKKPSELSVAKMQMMAWTAISLGIFILILLGNILDNNPTLPDVGTGLLTLMGVSHAGYNGNKIADKPPKP
jgi:di/tricarboxylate transporter